MDTQEKIEILERVVAQLLALQFHDAEGKESILEHLKEGVQESIKRTNRTNENASDFLDLLFKDALETSNEINERFQRFKDQNK